jgi:transcriptional regulator
MYIPPSNTEQDIPTLFEFIEAHPLGALVTASKAGDLVATHLPLLVHRDRGPFGTLEGHIARANAQHRQIDGSKEALVIFAGPDAYVTPTWYAAKQEHGRVVPTWNYVAVHVYGTLRVTDDPVVLERHLRSLTARHESGRGQPWSVSDAPADYVAQQIKAIVGVELAITRLEGKWKMSQNRSSADIDGVVRGLRASENPKDNEVAEIVQSRRPGDKESPRT